MQRRGPSVLLMLAALGADLLVACRASALPAAPPLYFVAPTPGDGALFTGGTVTVKLDASCSFNPATLAVSLNGVAIPASAFLPFSACTAGRMTSQTATAAVALPNGNIASGPSAITVGGSATFSGTGSGSALEWNFDGGAAPSTGSSVAPTFNAAGRFTVRLRATAAQALAASGMDGGNLVSAARTFRAGDPSPATHNLAVVMPPEVDFRNFESSQVHPLALSATGAELYAVNTPEGRLAIFAVAAGGGLSFAGDVPVGVDPVSLAVRPGTNEVWVVNHLSDTVSVVDAASRAPLATIAVGDEPTDIAFASGRAFVTLAGNQDRVKVFNASTRALVATLDLLGDDPRALAVNASGTEVYAVAMQSGNRTTIVSEFIVPNAGGPPPPSPARAPGLGTAPDVGLIVKFNPANGRWEDEVGGNWSSAITYTLPDQDIFAIDADAATPIVLRTLSGVGTTLFDVAVHPTTGQLWVPNTDARNLVRFEPNLRGHLVATRVARVNAVSGATTQVDLNPHISYAVTPGPPAEIAASLSQPGGGVFRSDGSAYYLTAFGSGKVAVLDGATGAVTARVNVGGGPSGVALNETDGRLYVLSRFDNAIASLDTATNTVVDNIGVAGPAAFDPSPDVIKIGRPFLYDAQLTSGHGDIACATCHTFGDFDGLAWDLGDPQGAFVPYSTAPWVNFAPIPADFTGFDPMKGPMVTQTLRGLEGIEPFHWRGDRQNFQHFNQAFVGLLGRGNQLASEDMDAYADFIMTVHYPPNPFRNVDDTMPASIAIPSKAGGGATTTGNPTSGAITFATSTVDGPFTCQTCHTLPTGTSTNLIGSTGLLSQDIKVAQVRNMYEKVGFSPIRTNPLGGNVTNIGLSAQKSGFGFLHDGIVSLTEFLAVSAFNMNDTQERNVFAFLLAFPTDTVPAIGSQVTVTAATKGNAALATAIATLIAQAEAGKCDVIAKGVLGGAAKGFAYDPATNLLAPDSAAEPALAESALRAALAGSDVLTYTGVPLGAATRLGIDRDRDGFLDRTELAFGTDAANPNSNPWQWVE